ncbi:jg22243, partial [Pararge aegeria aegeria]
TGGVRVQYVRRGRRRRGHWRGADAATRQRTRNEQPRCSSGSPTDSQHALGAGSIPDDQHFFMTAATEAAAAVARQRAALACSWTRAVRRHVAGAVSLAAGLPEITIKQCICFKFD